MRREEAWSRWLEGLESLDTGRGRCNSRLEALPGWNSAPLLISHLQSSPTCVAGKPSGVEPQSQWSFSTISNTNPSKKREFGTTNLFSIAALSGFTLPAQRQIRSIFPPLTQWKNCQRKINTLVFEALSSTTRGWFVRIESPDGIHCERVDQS